MYLEGIFYTSDFVVRGFMDTPLERVSDYLNIKSETSFVVYEVKVSRLLNAGKPQVIAMPEARLDKNSILFAIPAEIEKGQASFYRRANRIVYPVNVLLPNFVLFGSIHLTEKLETRRVLLSKPEDFIPLTDCTSTYTLNPNLSTRNNILIFNKNHMILIGENLQDDPAGAPPAST